MEQRKFSNTVIAVMLFLVGFAAFSLSGMFPKAISLTLPGWMQNYNSNLVATGFDVDDKLKYEMNNSVIPAGTFDKLDLFSNANCFNGISANEKKNRYYALEFDKTSKRTLFKCFSASKDKLKTNRKYKTLNTGNLIKVGNRLFISEGSGRMQVAFSKNLITDIYPDLSSYHKKDGTFDYRALAELLKKQTEERLTLNEFTVLLNEYFGRRIFAWYPESNTAYFKRIKDGNAYLIRYDTVSYEQKTYGPFVNSDIFYPFGQDRLICFDKNAKDLTVYDIESGKITYKLYGIEKEIAHFNYLVNNDVQLFGMLTTDNYACAYDISRETKDDKIRVHKDMSDFFKKRNAYNKKVLGVFLSENRFYYYKGNQLLWTYWED